MRFGWGDGDAGGRCGGREYGRGGRSLARSAAQGGQGHRALRCRRGRVAGSTRGDAWDAQAWDAQAFLGRECIDVGCVFVLVDLLVRVACIPRRSSRSMKDTSPKSWTWWTKEETQPCKCNNQSKDGRSNTNRSIHACPAWREKARVLARIATLAHACLPVLNFVRCVVFSSS